MNEGPRLWKNSTDNKQKQNKKKKGFGLTKN